LAKRKGSSDLVEIEYSSPDRFSTYHTLSILSEVFIRKYKELKDRETVTVIAYFENRLAESKAKLDGIEQKLLDFHVDNKIINYYEQTKQVTISKQQLLENIEKEKQLLASSESSLSNIELKLNKRAGILSVNELLLKKRNELSSLIYKISNLEAYQKSAKELPELKKQAEVLKEEIKSTISNIYDKNNSPEGLEHGSLIDDWIKYELAIDESKSRLKIMNKQLSEFANDYEKYAPMGSILKALERDAEISEKEYFEILHALNLARLKHQNIQYGNNLRILEPSLIPDNVGIKKRVILSGVSLLLGMFLIIAYLIGKELADPSLKNAKNFTTITTVRPIGTLLKPVKKPSKSYLLYEKVLAEQVKAHLDTQGDRLGVKAAFLSIRPHENQQEVLLQIARTFPQQANVSLHLIESKNQTNSITESLKIQFIPENSIQETLTNLLSKEEGAASNDSVVRKIHVFELPPLVKWPMAIQMAPMFDVLYLVVNAELSWGENEQYYFDQLRSNQSEKVAVIINNADFSRVKFDYKYLI
ncbi:MAG: hypothetical protein K2Q22_01120, partial [Cytophagales bacterium]|nr:hypothetical protein [Cytophagales bacterium]